ncbi:neuronal acetylcholine receptor subunit alpha-3-like [Saccostrea echinata]|uniref:neuronal acetylcholine receptor subunit alpha-3-like n=1 Tax=Saccostrea echinata TaxID=191078 RepID=UPI002A81405E|nr:neuronal acetylcholine receptor subunit alpha-3-like [Saccostrea echinata]
MKGVFLSIIIHCAFEGSSGAFTTTLATSIHADVLGISYNNHVRPSDVTNISIEFVLFSLNDLDMKSQTMSTSGWMTVKWKDPRLVWTKASYGDIEYIYTKQDKIWRPELIIDNSVGGMDPIGHDHLFFKVKNTDEVRWDPPGLFVTHCDIDIAYYPFDYQMCKIEVTSFAFTTEVMILNKSRNTVNSQDFNENGEWILYSSQVEERILEENEEKFSQLEFQIIFKRRPGYYLANIVYPVILISLLTNLSFLLPVDSGEKISYTLTVLLALVVLLMLVGESMPAASKHTPIIGIYKSIILMMAALGIFITVLNLRLYLNTDQTDVPKWLQCFTFTVLLKINCKSKKVEDTKLHQLDSVDDKTELQETNEGRKSLKRMMRHRSQTPAVHTEVHFPFQCKEVSAFLDTFFFYLFNIINLIVTVVLIIIIAVCDVPPV